MFVTRKMNKFGKQLLRMNSPRGEKALPADSLSLPRDDLVTYNALLVQSANTRYNESLDILQSLEHARIQLHCRLHGRLELVLHERRYAVVVSLVSAIVVPAPSNATANNEARHQTRYVFSALLTCRPDHPR